MGGVLTSLRVILTRYAPWFAKSKGDSQHDHDGHDLDEQLLSRLPNDVVVNILSRLDMVTLCRCMVVSPQLISSLLSQIQSLSTRTFAILTNHA